MNFFEKGFVYQITNKTNGMSYVGSTKSFKSRMKAHMGGNGLNGNNLLSKHMTKHGVESFDFKVLYYGEDYKREEPKFIIHFNTVYPNGYNLTVGLNDLSDYEVHKIEKNREVIFPCSEMAGKINSMSKRIYSMHKEIEYLKENQSVLFRFKVIATKLLRNKNKNN